MTLIDGCVLVGADNRLKVKRTPGMPIMNGEERNILSPFSYPLPIADAASDSRIEHSAESNQKSNTPSSTANESNDLKNILLNEDCRSRSEKTNSEAKVLSKSDGKHEDPQSNNKKLVIISEYVNNKLSDSKRLSEETSHKIEADNNHISSVSEDCPNSSTDKSESMDVPLVNTCTKKTAETSCVDTSRFNGTSVLPTLKVESSNSECDPPRSSSLKEISNVNSEEHGTPSSMKEKRDSTSVLLTSVDMETDVNNCTDVTASCDSSIETEQATQNDEVFACSNGANSSDNSFSQKLSDSAVVKPNHQTADGDTLAELSFESASEEMILQMEEDELLETDFQTRYGSKTKSEEESSIESEKTSNCDVENSTPKSENHSLSCDISRNVESALSVVVPETNTETLPTEIHEMEKVPSVASEKLPCDKVSMQTNLDSSNTLKEQCLKESSDLESKQSDNSISLGCTSVKQLSSDVVVETSDLLEKSVTLKSSASVNEMKEEEVHKKKVITSEEEHDSAPVSVYGKTQTSQISTSNEKSYSVSSAKNKDGVIVSDDTSLSYSDKMNSDTQSLINTDKEVCDVGFNVNSSNEPSKEIGKNVPQKSDSSEKSSNSEEIMSVENGALNVKEHDELSIESTSNNACPKISSSFLTRDNQVVQGETLPRALNEVISSAKDNATVPNENNDNISCNLDMLDMTVAKEDSITNKSIPESIQESNFSSVDAALIVALPEKNSNACLSTESLDVSKTKEEHCKTGLQSLKNNPILEIEDSHSHKNKLDGKAKCSMKNHEKEVAGSFDNNQKTKVDQDHVGENENRSCNSQDESTNLQSNDKKSLNQDNAEEIVLEDSMDTNSSEQSFPNKNEKEVNEANLKRDETIVVEVQNENQEETFSEDKELAQCKVEKKVTVDVDMSEAALKQDEKTAAEVQNENEEAADKEDKKITQTKTEEDITVNEGVNDAALKQDEKTAVKVQNENQEATNKEDKRLAQIKTQDEITVNVDVNDAAVKQDIKTPVKAESESGKKINVNEEMVKIDLHETEDTGLEVKSEDLDSLDHGGEKLAQCEKGTNESKFISEVNMDQEKAGNSQSQKNEGNKVSSEEGCCDKSLEEVIVHESPVDEKETETKEILKSSESPYVEDSEFVDDVETSADDEKETEQSFEELCSEELILDDSSMESEMPGNYSKERDRYLMSGSYIAPDSTDTSESEDEDEDYSSYENLNDEETTLSDIPDEGEDKGESLNEDLCENSQDSFFESMSNKIKDQLNELEDKSASDDKKTEDQINDSDSNVEKNETREKLSNADKLESLATSDFEAAECANSKESSLESHGLVSVNENLVKTGETSDPSEKSFQDESSFIEDISKEVVDRLINLVSNDSVCHDSSNEKQIVSITEHNLGEMSESVSSFPTEKISHIDHLYSAAPISSSSKIFDDFSISKRPASDELDEDKASNKRAREDEDFPSFNKRKLSGNSSSYGSSNKKLKIRDADDSNDNDGDTSDSSEESGKVTDDSHSSSSFDHSLSATNNDDAEEEVRRFNRFHRFSLQKFSRKDLEEIILLKMLEVLKYRGIAGEQQKQLTSLQEQCAAQKKLLSSIKKQYSESVIIMKKFIEQSESQQKKNVVPMKATRSVGLQVALVDSQNYPSKLDATSKEIKKLPQSPSIDKANKNPSLVKLKSVPSPVASSSNQQNSTVKTKPGKLLVPASPPKAAVPTLKVLTPVSRPTVVSQPLAQSRPLTQSTSQIITTLAQKPIPVTTKATNLEVIDLVDDSQQQGRSLGIQGVSSKGLTVAQTPAGKPQQQISYVVTSGTQVPIYISPPISQGSRMISSPINNRGVLSSPLKNGQFIQLQNKSGVLAGNQFHIVAANSSQLKQVIRPVMNLNSPQKSPQQFKHVPRILRPLHPAPLPAILTQASDKSWKLRPPKPTLRIGKNGSGITLSWTLNGYDKEKYAEIVSYQLFAYQEGTEPPNTDLWKKVGDVKALPLPMACTLTKFVSGHRYHFAVQAVDIHSRVGEYSTPDSILLN